MWNIAISTVHHFFTSESREMLEVLQFERFPEYSTSCARLRQGLLESRLNNNPLIGCLGALDGVAARICKPRASECSNPASYFHRK